MMSSRIPRVIHYVWVGGSEMPALVKRCIESWKKFAPDYELRFWDERTIPLEHPYVARMYAEKKWAFVSDYVRFWALQQEGGIYLDTDMELLKPLDDLLSNHAFLGRSKGGDIESSIVAAEPQHPLIQAALDFYDADSEYSIRNTSPLVLEKVLSENSFQNVRVYDATYFHPCNAGERCSKEVLAQAYARHHWAESWVPFSGVRKFLRAVGVMPVFKLMKKAFVQQHKVEREYKPFVSVALTTYNGGNFIREQIDSILSQTYSYFELVISDDGSDAETIAILDEYAAKDKRVSWSRSPLERGYVKNTENAISLCKGEIIFLCDQDDTWYPEKIELHVEQYRNPAVSWVYNRLVLTDEHNVETGHIEDTLPDYYRHKTMLENAWGTCIGGAQTSYRAHLVKKVMPADKYAPAHDSWIQIALNPLRGTFINRVLQTYRQHGRNEVGFGKVPTTDELAEQEERAIRENMRYLRHLPKNKTLALWKRAFFLAAYIAKRVRAEQRNLTRYYKK